MDREELNLKDNEAVKWQVRKLDNFERQILEVINTKDRNKLPFKLPAEVKWPMGVKDKSERAMIILRAGFESLKNKYEGQVQASFKQLKSEKNKEKMPRSKSDSGIDGWE